MSGGGSPHRSITLLMVTRKRAISSHPARVSKTVRNSKPSMMLMFWGARPRNHMLLK